MTNQYNFCKLLLISAIIGAPSAMGFVVSPQTKALFQPSSSFTTALQAKKKGNKAGKGFGKEAPAPPPTSSNSYSSDPYATQTKSAPSTGLQSVESGGSGAIPTIDSMASSSASASDSSIPAEERAGKVLREKYGLRTMAEQRTEDSLRENRERMDELKRLADKGEDFDIMAIVPPPILKGIDSFLKVGLGICTILFVSAGVAITAEAWSKASNSPLPDNIDSFIVTIVEPNFTYGLLVLLAFSVSLGGFAALQLSSGSAAYKEE